MKFIICLLAVLFLVNTANANNLVDNSDGTITDTDRNLMWLQNSGLGGEMNWLDAMDWVDTLVYAGYDNWRLPSALNSDGSGPCGSDFNCTDSEIGHLYYIEKGFSGGVMPGNSDPFTNFQEYYWTGNSRPYNDAYVFRFSNGYQSTASKDRVESFYAWAVRDCGGICPTTVVPEPISYTLFIIGSGVLGFRRFWKI